ncbi:hypothetical protein CPB84DRAFT_1792821 [Gymnopilus junonius]|uniref:Uncharacterized protein n=1 Tax=Gymnopilus junonius TaxID=109634 RepID=A0A9P5TIR4_GYMJU|nr:hypothetical protein CPB84DRAFT_1792821 [Gymnopilus junonius]
MSTLLLVPVLRLHRQASAWSDRSHGFMKLKSVETLLVIISLQRRSWNGTRSPFSVIIGRDNRTGLANELIKLFDALW